LTLVFPPLELPVPLDEELHAAMVRATGRTKAQRARMFIFSRRHETENGVKRISHMRLLPFMAVLVTFAGCGDDRDPGGAKLLWDRIQSERYQTWARAPNYDTVKPSFTVHADEVEILLNATMDDVARRGTAAKQWPVGSVVVKRGYSQGGSLVLVAAMEKRADGWFFAEYDPDGASVYSGRPSLCVDCHARAADSIWSVELPR
jgi:hypothetical protein